MIFKRKYAVLYFPDGTSEKVHIKCAIRFRLLNKNYRPFKIKKPLPLQWKKLSGGRFKLIKKKGGEISYEKKKS